jgi:hypothetical protein
MAMVNQPPGKPGPEREGATGTRKAPGVKTPCAFLDVVPAGKGYRIALFDTKTDTFKSYLVTGQEGTCGVSKDASGATVYRNMKEVEAALNKCKMEPCPPCECELKPKAKKKS